MTTNFTTGEILFAAKLLAALGERASTDLIGAPNGLATLGADGKLPLAQLPAIAIGDVFVVGSQAAMLALDAQRGDVAMRTDLSKTFILSTESPTTLADWKEVLVPAGGGVSSVAGRTGAITLVINDLSDAGATGKALAAASSAAIATAILNLATSAAKGLMPPLSGNSNQYLDGSGSFSTPAAPSPSYPQGYLFPRGLLGYSTTSQLTIAAGSARSGDNSTNFTWAGLTLNIATTGANGLDVSGSRATNGTVHVFVIYNPTTTTFAAFGSSSLTPTLPSGYTKSRRVGSIKLNASTNIIPFTMRGDFISYQTPFLDVSAAAFTGSPPVNQTLSVPSGIYVEAMVKPAASSTPATPDFYRFYDPADADVAVTANTANWNSDTTSPLSKAVAPLRVGTNTSSQIRASSGGSSDSINLTIFGYYDRRDQ